MLISRTSQFAVMLKDEKPYPVARLQFVKWDKRPSIGGSEWSQRLLAGEWSLDVYPVSRLQRARAREALCKNGLPAMAAWIRQPRPAGWFFGRKICELVWHPGESIVELQSREEKM